MPVSLFIFARLTGDVLKIFMQDLNIHFGGIE